MARRWSPEDKEKMFQKVLELTQERKLVVPYDRKVFIALIKEAMFVSLPFDQQHSTSDINRFMWIEERVLAILKPKPVEPVVQAPVIDTAALVESVSETLTHSSELLELIRSQIIATPAIQDLIAGVSDTLVSEIVKATVAKITAPETVEKLIAKPVAIAQAPAAPAAVQAVEKPAAVAAVPVVPAVATAPVVPPAATPAADAAPVKLIDKKPLVVIAGVQASMLRQLFDFQATNEKGLDVKLISPTEVTRNYHYIDKADLLLVIRGSMSKDLISKIERRNTRWFEVESSVREDIPSKAIHYIEDWYLRSTVMGKTSPLPSQKVRSKAV